MREEGFVADLASEGVEAGSAAEVEFGEGGGNGVVFVVVEDAMPGLGKKPRVRQAGEKVIVPA